MTPEDEDALIYAITTIANCMESIDKHLKGIEESLEVIKFNQS